MLMVDLHLKAEHEVETKVETGKKTGTKTEKVRRPEVTPEMSEDRWAYFKARWEAYKKGCDLEGEAAMDQLLECLSEPLQTVLRGGGRG